LKSRGWLTRFVLSDRLVHNPKGKINMFTKKDNYLIIGMLAGVGIGTAIGAAFGNIPVGIVVGISLGAAIATFWIEKKN
jgi:F0F1-type ATP synthase assembly protein I